MEIRYYSMTFIPMIGILLFWYFVVYPYTKQCIIKYECVVRGVRKNNQQCSLVEQQCNQCTQDVASLESDYFACAVENRTACAHDVMVEKVIRSMEKNGITLMYFHIKNSDKKSWLYECAATIHGEATNSAILSFFKENTTYSQGFIPRDILLKRKDHVMQLVTSIVWFRCEKSL